MDEIQTAQQAVSDIANMALSAILESLSIGNLVYRDFEPHLAMPGDTVNVPVTPVLVAREMGSGPIPCQSVKNVQIILDRHMEASVTVPDVCALSQTALLECQIRPMGIALAQQIEIDLLAAASEFPALGKSGPISKALIDEAENILFDNYVPFRAQKNLILSPDSHRALTAIELQRPRPFNAVRSQFVPTRNVRSWRDLFRRRTRSENVAFANNALGLATRRLPLPLHGTGALGAYAERDDFGLRAIICYEPETLSQMITVDVLYGCGILREEFGVRIPTRDK